MGQGQKKMFQFVITNKDIDDAYYKLPMKLELGEPFRGRSVSLDTLNLGANILYTTTNNTSEWHELNMDDIICAISPLDGHLMFRRDVVRLIKSKLDLHIHYA